LTISATTRLSAEEISTGVRFADKAGLSLLESGHLGEEFVDAAGRTYDAMGSPGAYQFWNAGQFANSILTHLNKAVDFVIIDLRGATKDQIKAVKDFVRTLSKEQQNRIKYLQ
jgi:hypothetical protein